MMSGDNGHHPAVRMENVTKSFDGRKVLDGLSFQVASGEGFCLLGRSGIGKSVTLKLLIGLLKPDSGRIFIEEDEVPRLKGVQLAEARKKIGFLFQAAALFDSISVRENVAFPLRRHTKKSDEEIREIANEKLREVELEKDGDKMPSELSGGMQKRAGLARALALDPPIILVDEPSSGLDKITASEIYDLLQSLKEKRHVTLVAVTHDVPGARKFADRFAVLAKGKIVACGSPDELMNSDSEEVRELASGEQR
jgi:phospholipid/cholesterol/gamma-HCH transport system ATP-binding protein